MRKLLDKMSADDRNVFQIDTNGIQWDAYMENYCLGVRNYLLKQNGDTIVNCRKDMERLTGFFLKFKRLFKNLFFNFFSDFVTIIICLYFV